MNDVKLLLNAYFELLYERLIAHQNHCAQRVEVLLRDEFQRQSFGRCDDDIFSAYRDAAHAFIAERLETYNPIGVQYTFNGASRREAFEIEIQFDWYDNKAEFDALVRAAQHLTQPDMPADDLAQAARKLVDRRGAYPDASIIENYLDQPELRRLPDYVVARAIEEVIRQDSG